MLNGEQIGICDVIQKNGRRKQCSVNRIGKRFKETGDHDAEHHERKDPVFRTGTLDTDPGYVTEDQQYKNPNPVCQKDRLKIHDIKHTQTPSEPSVFLHAVPFRFKTAEQQLFPIRPCGNFRRTVHKHPNIHADIHADNRVMQEGWGGLLGEKLLLLYSFYVIYY